MSDASGSSRRRRHSARRPATRVAFEPLERRALLSIGLDTTYGTYAGFTSVPWGGQFVSNVSLASLPDGRTYVATGLGLGSGLARLTMDGNLDPTFGSGGEVPFYASGNQRIITAVTVQPDLKLLAGGDFSVLRLNPDGTTDAAFGTNGVAYALPDTGRVTSADTSQILVQADGKIVVIGESSNGNHNRAGMVRFNADGTLDTAFGNNGRVTIDLTPLLGGSFVGASFFGQGLILPDGKILLTARTEVGMALVRYNVNGTLDATFGSGGIARPDTPYTDATAIAAAPGGGYYVFASNINGLAAAVSKWTAAGTIDTVFGTNGFAPFTGPGIYGGDLAVQADGSIVAGMNFQDGYDYPFPRGWILAVIQPDGSQVREVDRQIVNPYGLGGGMVLAPDGRALIVGANVSYPDPRPARDPLIYRYRTLPDPPKGVRLDGSVLTVLGDDSANTAAVTTDGANWLVTLDGVTQSFPTSAVTRVDFRMLGGDDAVTTPVGLPVGNVDLGDGNDTVTLNGASAHLLIGGNGADVFNLPAAPVGGPVANIGIWADAADTLNLTGTDGADGFSITSTSADAPGRHITYTGLGHLNLDAGDGDDAVTLNDSAGPVAVVRGGNGADRFTTTGGGPAGTPNVIYGGAGDDALVATAGSGTLQFEGDAGANAVSLTGTSGNDAITLKDGAITTAGGYTLSELDPPNVAALVVDGAGGNDTFALAITNPNLPVTVLGGAGADALLASYSPSLPWSNLVFQAGGNAGDSATFTEVGSASHAYAIGGGTIRRDGSDTARFTGLDSLTLNTDDAGNSVTVNDANGLTSLAVVGGAGDDVFQVTRNATGLGMKPNPIPDQGPGVQFSGGKGGINVFRVVPDPVATYAVAGGAGASDRLELDYTGVANPRLTSQGVGAGTYTFAAQQAVSFSGIESVNDLPAPGNPNIGFHGGWPQSLVYTFVGDVGASLTADDLQLTNLTSNQRVPTSDLALSYDPSTRTATFTFPNYPGGALPAGTYQAFLPAGSVSDPAAGPMLADYLFAFSLNASVAGTVFDDVNQNGAINGGEPGLPNRTVFLDLNNNGALDANEPSTLTAGNGTFKFSGLFAGNYAVRQVVAPGWVGSLPANGAGYAIVLKAGQAVTGKNFGTYPTAAVPAAPAAAAVAAASSWGAHVTWTTPSAGSSTPQGFRVLRAVSGSNAYAVAGTVADPNATSFDDVNALLPNKSYDYVVQAYLDAYDSPYSAAATITTPALALAAGSPNAVYLRKDADGKHLDLWINAATPGQGAPSAQAVTAQSAALALTGGTGDDVITLDLSNGNPLPGGGLTFDGGAGNNAIRLVGSPGDDTFTASASVLTIASTTAGTAHVTLANTQAIQLAPNSGGNDALDVTGGAWQVDAGTTATPNVTVTVANGATVSFAAPQSLAALTVNGSAQFTPAAAGTTFSVGNLTVATTGSLDLGSGNLLTNDTVAAVRQMLANGYANGAWNGNATADGVGAIRSAAANAAGAGATARALGYATSADLASVPAGQTLVQYTVPGDANLSGTTDFNDFLVLQNHFNQPGTWTQGDIDYNGTVDFNDFLVLQNNYNHAMPPPPPSPAADVPSVAARVPDVTPAPVSSAEVGATSTTAATLSPSNASPPSTAPGPTTTTVVHPAPMKGTTVTVPPGVPPAIAAPSVTPPKPAAMPVGPHVPNPPTRRPARHQPPKPPKQALPPAHRAASMPVSKPTVAPASTAKPRHRRHVWDG